MDIVEVIMRNGADGVVPWTDADSAELRPSRGEQRRIRRKLGLKGVVRQQGHGSLDVRNCDSGNPTCVYSKGGPQ